MATEPHSVAKLEERLLDLLPDGVEKSVSELAKASGVAGPQLSNALRKLLFLDDVHVSKGGGRSGERHFKRGPAPESNRTPRAKASTAPASKWPAMDPVIPAAFHAMATLGHKKRSSEARMFAPGDTS
jgi:hypothetical protein